jgi:hypothetical protein
LFPTLNEARGECERLKTRKDNFGISLSSMTPARVAEAAEAFKLLGSYPGVSLLDAVRGHLAALKRRSASVPFRQLFGMYLEAKGSRSPKYLRELRITLERFADIHPMIATEITAFQLEPTLDRLGPSSRNATMRYLRAVFRYGLKRGLLSEDPISRLDFADVRRREVETIAEPTVRAMMEHALCEDLELLPFLTLGFFCGIRPDGELQKLDAPIWSR